MRIEELQEVLNFVRRFPWVSDQALFGVPEKWQRISILGRGDCDDYVLETEYLLTERGWPPEHLRRGVVLTEKRERHLVLSVWTPEREWIIDQRHAQVQTIGSLLRVGYTPDQIQERGGSLNFRAWVWPTA